MLSDEQIVTGERLLVGIEQIADAIERLNKLGRSLPGMPILSIRFGSSPRIYGENGYAALVNRMIADEYSDRILAQMQREQERLAA